MEFTTYFCADGVLRASWGDEKRLIPLKFLQNHSDRRKSDLRFWAFWSNQTVYFEKGLTISGFINALEPWKEYFSDFLDKDIAAYIKEVNKPTLVKDDDSEEQLDWACLFSHTEMSPEIKWHHDEAEKLLDLFQSRKKSLTGFWQFDSGYHLSGFKYNTQEHYNIDGRALNEIANLELYLSDIENVVLLTYNVEELASKEHKLFNENGFGLRHAQSGSNSHLQFLATKRAHGLLEVIDGFFDWFAKTPAHRDEMNEEIRQSLADFRQTRDEEKEKIKPHLSLVSDNTQVQELETSNSLNVRVAPGAFDNVVSGWEKQSTIWDVMWSDYLKTDDNKRIGIQPSTPPEHKVYGYTTELEDLETPYKRF